MTKAKKQLLAGRSVQVNETENSHNCHTGRGEAVIRYPGWFFFSWIPDIRRRRIPE